MGDCPWGRGAGGPLLLPGHWGPVFSEGDNGTPVPLPTRAASPVVPPPTRLRYPPSGPVGPHRPSAEAPEHHLDLHGAAPALLPHRGLGVRAIHGGPLRGQGAADLGRGPRGAPRGQCCLRVDTAVHVARAAVHRVCVAAQGHGAGAARVGG